MMYSHVCSYTIALAVLYLQLLVHGGVKVVTG